jgi:predicted nuclease of predicted toxin-antitoxin system
MKFIVDESAGMAIAQYLRGIGHDVVAVAETIPQADDQTILIKAASESRVLITNDKDFGELVFRSGYAHHGVLFPSPISTPDRTPQIILIDLVVDLV